MFDDRTPEKIKAEMLARISQSTGLSAMAGSFADAVTGPVASQLSQLYKALPAVTSMLFVDEGSGEFLDLVGETYFDIKRREGTKARCNIVLSGDTGSVINAGTVFLTAAGLQFKLVKTVTLPGEGTLEAVELGAEYNIGAGEISRMYINPLGLASYVNSVATGGTDRESDKALLARIEERRRRPANGANGWQYRQWALGVPGVGEAKVTELANGPGTVGVTVTDSNFRAASADIVEACSEFIASMRPIGALPTVVSASELELHVSAEVVISPTATAAAVREEFMERLCEYTEGLISDKYRKIYYTPDEDTAYTLIYNRVLALLLTIDGVVNAASLTVNGAAADIIIPSETIPVIGAVEVSA